MYSHIVFTGGGLSGISYLGVIRYMQEIGMHNHIHEVAGTSIGALFACIFAMNIMAGDFEEYLKEYIKNDKNVSFAILDSVVSFLDTYGIDDGERLIRPIKHFVQKNFHWKKDTITFREFAKKTGKNLIICATNMHKRSSKYFSVDSTPDVCIYDALQASMTLPFLMKPVIINDEMYIDGGVCDDIPFQGFKQIRMNSLLVIGTGGIIDKETLPNNIMNYISIIFEILLNNNKPSNETITKKTNVYHHLLLDKIPIPFLKIEPSNDGYLRIVINENDIDAAIAYGYTKMYEFVKDYRENEKIT
jgi:predicted acylesterase/phospholipase RssA